MSTYREISRGYEHNHLAATADRLEQDGYQKLADDYRRRASEAETVFSHLRQLGKLAARSRRTVAAEAGADIADEVIRLGWTPPSFLPTAGVDK